MTENESFWRKCSSCKKPIALGGTYYVCSVTSCSPKRAPTQFCTADCLDVHNEVYNHRNAGAIEETAPLTQDPITQPESPDSEFPKEKTSVKLSETTVDRDILVVVSKVKKYILEKSGMNTSKDMMDALTKIVINACDGAIDNARDAGRKTVMKRDVNLDNVRGTD